MLTPQNEIFQRINAIKNAVHADFPQLHGIFIFSRINIYYFSGTLANGVLYIPFTGAPILFVRKGLERAKKECPFNHIYTYKSYSEIEKHCTDLGVPLLKQAVFGIEKSGLTLQLAELFLTKINAFSTHTPINIDTQIKNIRSIKSPYEREKIREAGKRQALVLEKILPHYLQQAIYTNNISLPSLVDEYDSKLKKLFPSDRKLSEINIAKLCIQLYTELDHGFLCRMSAHGEEAFYGHIACGNNLNQPHYYNGAMGFAGIHSALPCLGSQKIWQKNEPLLVDMLFNYQGYHTDKTQMYFYGTEKDLPDNAKRAYDCCFEIQQMTLRNLKADTVPEELYFNALNLVAKYGFSENFMGYSQNSVPFLGHGIGLNVDEFPVIAKGFKTPLQNGMTIACEPKIGLPNFGMVGIENTFELIDNTIINLTSNQEGIIFIN